MRHASITAAFLLIAASPAFAGVVAEQTVEKETIVRDVDGVERVSREAADKVAPGEEIIYTLKFSNDSAEAAEAVVLVMPVPNEVSYLEGSVFGDNTTVTFSADGGQTYVARGRLTVEEQGSQRPANSDEITHIKWTLTEALSPSATGEVSYRAILK